LHDLACQSLILRRDIEKRAHALSLENDAAAIFVGLDQIVHARIGEQLFETQRFLESLRNVDQVQFLVAEMIREQVLKLTEETRGGEEPFDWKVSPGAISEAEDRGAGE